MKAIEYFEKYFKNIDAQHPTEEAILNSASLMMKEMINEIDVLSKARKVSTGVGLVGIVKEINDKWNSVVSKTTKHFSLQCLKRNVIYNMLLAEELPERFPPLPEE